MNWKVYVLAGLLVLAFVGYAAHSIKRNGALEAELKTARAENEKLLADKERLDNALLARERERDKAIAEVAHAKTEIERLAAKDVALRAWLDADLHHAVADILRNLDGPGVPFRRADTALPGP